MHHCLNNDVFLYARITDADARKPFMEDEGRLTAVGEGEHSGTQELFILKSGKHRDLRNLVALRGGDRKRDGGNAWKQYKAIAQTYAHPIRNMIRNRK